MTDKTTTSSAAVRPTKRVVFDGESRPDYKLLNEIVAAAQGWIRSSGGEHGESIEVWHGDTEYAFQGRAVIDFLYAAKDRALDGVRAALDLIDYIEESAKQPASKFVRDAIVLKAREAKVAIDG